MTISEPLFQMENIHLERDKNVILHDFHWKVSPGEHWVIFGPNGAGKTSILNVLQAYLWPTTGKVKVFGGTLGDGVNVFDMRRQIAVVSESVRNLINNNLTGREVIVTGLRGHLNLFSDETPEEIERAEELATRTGITSLLKKPFRVMSTGERQRILITRALTEQPRILVLDEPCSGLDLAGREWVLHTIERVAAQENAPSLLLTTHHVEEMTAAFTHALLIKEGRAFAQGTLDAVFTGENLSELFGMEIQVEKVGTRRTAHGRVRF